MTIKALIRSKIAEKSTNQTELAEKAGFKSQSNISMMLKKGNMRVNNLFALLDALDCELVVRDKTTGVESVIVPDGQKGEI